MPLDFDDLVSQFGSASDIPNELLYSFLEEKREDLINLAKLGLDQIPESKLGREVRRRCKTDLMWMARYFTWETNPVGMGRPLSDNLVTEEHYRPVIDLFLKKDGVTPLAQLSEVKTRLLLWPRGGMKSSLDHVDSVQLILNYPDIRILYLTAEASLAEGFVGEVKGHLLIKEEPTLMNLFFPEFCVEEKDSGAKYTFTCPVFAAKKTKRKEPTVYASSVGKTKSGWHYEVIKADDAVSDKNTLTSDQCESVSKQLFLAEKLLALGGYYIDYIGTRYADADHYGRLLEQNMLGDVQTTTGPGWVFYQNNTTGINILIGKAIQIKPEVSAQLEKEGRPVTYQEAGEEGCVLLLPHVMSFRWLMSDLAKDEKSFEGQRNQNPHIASEIEFTRLLLLQNTVPYTQIPREGVITQTWDFAYSSAKGRDYSVGCSVLWGRDDQGDPVGYVLEVVRGRMNPAALSKAIVEQAVRYRPYIIGVEKSAGAEFLADTISIEASKTGDAEIVASCSRIDWFPVDNQKDAKKVRMRMLYPHLLRGGLKFAAHCMARNIEPQNKTIETLYSEFEKCLISHHHDDIPDVISQQFRLYMPRAFQAIISDDSDVRSNSDPSYNLIFGDSTDPFGRMGYGPPAAILPFPDDLLMDDEPEMRGESPDGLPPMLGAGMFG